MRNQEPVVEWPTLLLLAATYLVWGCATTLLYPLSPLLAVLVTGIAIAQFSSLQHEVLHGHPFRSRILNEALVFPALTLIVPYRRFRDVHLAHHYDPNLTDPYDDPETNFVDPVVWNGLSRPIKVLLRVNNTLLGRMTIGPLIGAFVWLSGEATLILQGNRLVQRAWGLHMLGLALVVGWLWLVAMPWWAYLLATWIGLGLLKIRTYLEHRAHDAARGRTVIIEDRGPLSILFLNNNFHAVHHMHPNEPWYRLPATYLAGKEHYLRRNDGYVYQSYAQIFRKYFFVAKDPVPHPLMPVRKQPQQAASGLQSHVAD
jgi:fatty acid desaturase